MSNVKTMTIELQDKEVKKDECVVHKKTDNILDGKFEKISNY